MTKTNTNEQEGIEALAARMSALRDHGLSNLMSDQLHVLRRIDEDPADLFGADDLLKPYNDELTVWEREHLTARLGEWLDVIEANRRDDAGAKVFNVRAFGAVGDGRQDDRPAIEQAIAAAAALGHASIVSIPAGRYRLSRPGGSAAHLRLAAVRDIVLQGEPGTELLGTEPTTLLRLEDCRNIRIRSIALDYDPLLHMQGTITEIAPDRASLVFAIAEGYPQPDDWGLDRTMPSEGWKVKLGDVFVNVMLMEQNGHYLGHLNPDLQKAERVGPRTWRLSFRPGKPVHEKVAPSFPLLLNRQTYWTHGTVISGCEWIDLNRVEIWGATQFSLYIESSTGVSVRNSAVRPKPDGKRLGGIVRDGIHCRSNRYGPFIERCTVLRPADDCFNFQSKMVSVDAVVDDRTLVLGLPWEEADRLGYWTPRRKDFVVGDMLAFVSPLTGELAGWARIVAVAPHDWHGHCRLRTTLDRAVPGLVSRDACGKHEPVRSSMEFLLLDKPHALEHFVFNVSTKSDGFVIRDCTLGENSATGGKIKAGTGLILNNVSRDHGWCVWSFASEPAWQEGYAARRVLVQGGRHDNWFGIFVGSQYPFGRHHIGTPFNYRLEILDNEFVGIRQKEYALDINSVVGCTVTGNTVPGERMIAVGPTARQVLLTANHGKGESQ